ncbi:carboxypeptidase-like regulatory domain-containing protein [Algoriphagus resistens]|uniref:carboxypeptidase-like regulatory domain-containing protein n=1 Tax=Algoriphagus resistens TaxID=1750590 RepID=UPI000716AAA5|nr:carboxypeptidase-like regulatory domain-containing protein [Algoriphagus resistens]
MKKTLIESQKIKLRRLTMGILSIFILFLGGVIFSATQLTAATEKELKSDKTVKGLILSPDKKPIPGAVIIVKDTDTGTVADIDGVFSMDLQYFEEESVTLTISMTEYESTEVVVKTNKLPKDLGKITLQKETE